MVYTKCDSDGQRCIYIYLLLYKQSGILNTVLDLEKLM